MGDLHPPRDGIRCPCCESEEALAATCLAVNREMPGAGLGMKLREVLRRMKGTANPAKVQRVLEAAEREPDE